ncbi:MAG: spermidine synthase [Kiritimatiellae bacterium]|jgi:spermidine synthase|nr:spermidine synthase [Kiritimatiellia bacterium]
MARDEEYADMGAGLRQSYLAAVTVFTGSFLLFLMQPVLGRTLLPSFGGAASVWVICLASFQTLLLVGYFYAHWFRNSRSAGKSLHLALLILAALSVFAVIFFRTDVEGFIQGPSSNLISVMLGILVFASLPYVLLASGSTLVQAWMARSHTKGDLYHLYAISNIGSFTGLLCYPFIVEPFVPVNLQWYALGVLMLLYCIMLKLFVFKLDDSPKEECDCALEPVRDVKKWTWFIIPAISSFMLNAVIAHMFIDVTPLPLIWVLFVACFLLSYVVGFSRFGSSLLKLWWSLAMVSVFFAVMVRGVVGVGSFAVNGSASAAMLIFCGIWMHSFLYENRPEYDRLTRYYLMLAAGGAVGGILSAVAAPLLFSSVFEYPLILWVCALFLGWWLLDSIAFFRNRKLLLRLLVIVWATVLIIIVSAGGRHSASRVRYQKRNFYGTISVTQTIESFGKEGSHNVNYLWCGQTTHGIQATGSSLRTKGTSYYGNTGGGIAVTAHPKFKNNNPMVVGIVGLGVGTMACYGRPDDLYRFYEINPLAVEVAKDRSLFTYLSDSKAAIDLIEGDARQMLEFEQVAGDPLYDVLMIDAYSGDAVPCHLATREAFELYLNRLAPDGILAVHVSNWHIDLLPLCKVAAQELNLVPYGVVGVKENTLTTSSVWVFMTRKKFTYRYPLWTQVREIDWDKVRDIKLPVDDCGSLVSLIRWL